MSKKKKKQIQQDRLKEFEHQTEDHYEERKIGDKWFIKMWNGGTNKWQVAIYSEESYSRYKRFREDEVEFLYQINKD